MTPAARPAAGGWSGGHDGAWVADLPSEPIATIVAELFTTPTHPSSVTVRSGSIARPYTVPLAPTTTARNRDAGRARVRASRTGPSHRGRSPRSGRRGRSTADPAPGRGRRQARRPALREGSRSRSSSGHSHRCPRGPLRSDTATPSARCRPARGPRRPCRRRRPGLRRARRSRSGRRPAARDGMDRRRSSRRRHDGEPGRPARHAGAVSLERADQAARPESAARTTNTRPLGPTTGSDATPSIVTGQPVRAPARPKAAIFVLRARAGADRSDGERGAVCAERTAPPVRAGRQRELLADGHAGRGRDAHEPKSLVPGPSAAGG